MLFISIFISVYRIVGKGIFTSITSLNYPFNNAISLILSPAILLDPLIYNHMKNDDGEINGNKTFKESF